MRISITGISKMRWLRSEVSNNRGYQLDYAGKNDANHFNEVANVVARHIIPSEESSFLNLDIVILVQFTIHPKPFTVNEIQVYGLNKLRKQSKEN